MTLDTQTYGFPNNIALRIQNDIVCDFFWTRYKFLTQTAPFILEPVGVRLFEPVGVRLLEPVDVRLFFSTKPGKFDHLKIDRF